MADHADDDVGDIFVYRGGRVPRHVTRVRIDKSVEEIEEIAFYNCEHLVHVETHDGIRRVRKCAFYNCKLLRRIHLKSVVEIGKCAFKGCRSLQHLNLPSIITIGRLAFWKCMALTDVELSERLETIKGRAFLDCKRLQRIAIPLKRDMIPFDDILQQYNQFDQCEHLVTVDLVGGIHKTIASFHMEKWRTEVEEEIHRINQVLPYTPADDKAEAIRQWMDAVLDKMDHYKGEHYRYVKEGITLLELALWKAKLGEKEDSSKEGRTKKAKVDAVSARKGTRITYGAEIVIKNVLPFLKLV
eukprot:scaffold14356_cov194-Skeletonema_marinoi.AAC.3